MSGFKEPNFADRQKAAQQARQNILNKFRAQPGPDDPAVKQKLAEREAVAAARAKAKEARDAAKAEQKKRDAETAAAEAVRVAREKEEEAAEAGRAGGRTEGKARRALCRTQEQGQEEVASRPGGAGHVTGPPRERRARATDAWSVFKRRVPVRLKKTSEQKIEPGSDSIGTRL